MATCTGGFDPGLARLRRREHPADANLPPRGAVPPPMSERLPCGTRARRVAGGKATTDLAIEVGEVLTCAGVRDASMGPDRPNPSETGRVILFRPRQAGSRQLGPVQSPKRATGFRELPSAREDDDRHRRFIHLLGLAFCLILAVAGVWVANEFTEMKRVQDCVSSGRSGCIPLDVVAHSNF